MSGSTPRSKRYRRVTPPSGRSTQLAALPTSSTEAEDPPTDEEEGPCAYDLLVGSLRPVKRAKVEGGAEGLEGERTESVGAEGGAEGLEGERTESVGVEGGAEGLEGERTESVGTEGVTVEVAESDGGSTSDEESEGEGITNDREGNSDLNSGRGSDPFAEHVEQDLSEAEVASLRHTLTQPLHYEQAAHPVLGLVGVATCLPSRVSPIHQEEGLLSELHVRRRLVTLWSSTQGGVGDQAPLTPLQHHLFAILNSYKDLLFTRRTVDNAEAVRKTYVLHALNHVLKTRSRVLKNNSRLALANREGRHITELWDQGLTRPRVLILLPFREAALRTVNCIISLLLPQGQGQVSHRRRLQEEFGEPQDCIPPVTPKPASFQAMFAGNIDDCFRLGIAVGRNTVKLYSEFYKSDIILASPLGLRTIIGAEGEKRRDFDFLSSLELVVVDQADVFLMQNWEHLTHTFHHMHCQPQHSHGVDFSRVRLWAINGWGQHYRQSLVFSSFPTPEINALFKKHCLNYAGKVRVSEPSLEGSVRQVVTQVPQLFRRIQVSSFSNLPDARFTYFIEQVLPDYRGELMKQTAIFIPSYFDFVRIRNYMKKEGLSFAQICEYTKTSDISRARTLFLQGRRHFLLLTERVHFFRRLWVRGAHHLLLFSPPTYPEFYPEVANLLEGGGATCTVLYTRYDSLSLARVVGGDRASRMLEAEESSCMLVTGD